MPLYRMENGRRVQLSTGEEDAHNAGLVVNMGIQVEARKASIIEAVERRLIRRAVRNFVMTATDATLKTKYQSTIAAINAATDMAALDAIDPNLAT